MKSVIVFRDGRRVNLAAGVTPEMYAELEALRSPRHDPALFCGGCGGGLYIQHGRKDRDELFGYHHPGADCAETHVISTSAMSDEHKRMTDYHVLAAQAEGLDAETEVTTSGRTRVDIVVDGRIGFEVQRSALTARAAMDRTARSTASGLEVVAWCADVSSTQWNGKVPGYRVPDQAQHWKVVPDLKSVKAVGVWTYQAARSWRGGWRPELTPAALLVDDLIVRMASGAIRPAVVGKYVRLMTADGIALFGEMTGRSLTAYDPGKPVARVLPAAPEAECKRPRAVAVVPPSSSFTVRRGICHTPECGQPAQLYPAGWLCGRHRPGRIPA